MTGRSLGPCGDAMVFDRALQGRGRGGGGRGYCHWFQATGLTGWQRGNQRFADTPGQQLRGSTLRGPSSPGTSSEESLATLKTQQEHLENALHALKARGRELQASTKE
jgi:hypothetical protein